MSDRNTSTGAGEDDQPPPLPEETGADGTQTIPPSGSKSLVPARPVELDDHHVGAALSEFGASRSPGVQALTTALYRGAQATLSAVMEKWQGAERDKDLLRDRLSDSQRTVAVLHERIRNLVRLNRVQNLGGVLIGTGLGIAYAESTVFGLGGVFIVLGGILFVLGLGPRQAGVE